jgi:signal peptide peptidase SppA
MKHQILAGIDVAGPWAMNLPHLEAFLSELQVAVDIIESDPKAKKQQDGESGYDCEEPPYEMRGSVACVPVHGVVLKSVPWILRAFGINATSTQATRKALTHAIENKEVTSIELNIDSPGGTVAGVQELSDDIAKLTKPVTAKISDLCASAAYWLASQTQGISANAGAQVGSIGVYTVMRDSSRAAENAGIKTHVLASHPLKGAGVPGSVVTDEQLADTQRLIDATANLFTAHVMRGRKMTDEQVKKVATGQVWLADEAKKFGLIDQVGSSVAVHAAASPQTKPLLGVIEESEMADKNIGTVAAVQGDEELQAYKARAEKAEAEALKVKAELDNANALRTAKLEDDRKALVDKYRDRFSAAGLDGVIKAVSGYGDNLVEAEKWLQSMSPVTHAQRVSSPGAVSDVGVKSAQKINEKIAETIGGSAGDLEFASQFETFTADGYCVRHDGTKILKKNWVAEKAAWLKKMGYAVAMALVFVLAMPSANAALSKARNTTCKGTPNIQAYLMTASSTIYAGGLVMVDSAGTAVAAAAASSNHNVVGVAQETKTSASSGSYWIKVADRQICLFAGDTLEQDDVGKIVYADDDQTVDETVASNDPVAGILVQYVSASAGWVYIDAAVNVGRVQTISEPLTLSDSTGLTLSNAEVISNGTDGKIRMAAAGGTYNENVSFDLESASNYLTLSSSSGVVGVDFGAVGTTLKLKQGQTIDSSTNNVFVFADDEDLTLTFGSNSATFASTTGALFTFTPATTFSGAVTVSGALDVSSLTGTGATGVGVTAASSTNQACNTTCSTATCLAGYDVGGAVFVACNSANADTCLCLP